MERGTDVVGVPIEEECKGFCGCLNVRGVFIKFSDCSNAFYILCMCLFDVFL